MVGEVDGKKLERKLAVDMRMKELLSARKWQSSARERAGDLVALADNILSDYVSGLAA